jgi:hypothetical protein
MTFTPFKTPKHLTSIAVRSAIAGLFIPLLFTATAANGQQFDSSQSTGIKSVSGLQLEADDHRKLLREEFGAYDEALAEALHQVGRRYQEAGEHELALDFLKDAWQISKVNHGIFSAAQVPTLELIIYSEMELQRWESVDNHYAYLELLHRRVYAANDPQLELGLQKVSAWHVHALSIRDSAKQVAHLRKAYHLFKDRLELAEANLDPADPKFGYLKESIQITEQRLRVMAQKDNGLVWQPSIAGSSLLADSY